MGSDYYNTGYSQREIEAYLRKTQNCIHKRQFIIALGVNRQENIDFINEFRLTDRRQKEILLKIDVEDFCYSLKNTNPGFEDEELYVFCPQVELYNINGTKEKVDIYTKFNLIETYDKETLVVISFHKKNRPISYLFC